MKKLIKSFFSVLVLFGVVALLVACIKPVEYTVSFEANGGSGVSSEKVLDGEKIEVEPATTRDGYIFRGWFEDEGFSGNRITFPYAVTKDVKLYAKWEKEADPDPEPIDYKVSFVTDGGSAVADQTIESGKTIATEPVTEKQNFDFAGWFDNNNFTGNRIEFPYVVTKEVTLYAKWAPVPVADTGTPVGYTYVIGAYEWGPMIDKVVFEYETERGLVSQSRYSIKYDSSGGWGAANYQEKTITKSYISDENGNQTDEPSKYITLEFKVEYAMVELFPGFSMGMASESGSPFTYDMGSGLNSWNNLATQYQVKVDGNDVTYDGYYVPAIKDFKKTSYTNQADNITLQRAAFETAAMQNDGVKNALIIWLHGAGEGGTDVEIALLGNDITALAEEGIQKYFTKDGGEQGAYVLAVQTPTMWMDSGSGQHSGDQGSIYNDALWGAIKDYVNNNTDVDANRIYIGGCSNGGYMTMSMLFDGGADYFAAAYPICEAYMDSAITADMINDIKDVPIWFTHSADDTTVAPTNYTNATYVRLIAAGATNVHYSYFASVQGQDANVTHMGHWSWIYTLQDRCVYDQNAANITVVADLVVPSATEVKIDGNAVTLWGWLAQQVKPEA